MIFSRLEWLAAMGKWRATMSIPTLFFRRRRRFLPIFFFFFYFYYYKIMIMTIMIMKTIIIFFNLKQNAHPKRKCAYSFVRCWSFLLKPQSVAQGPVPRKMVLTKKKFKPGLSQRFPCLWTCNSCLQNTVEPLLGDTVIITQNVTLSHTLGRWIQKRNKILIPDYR